jgi:hypothetical protein
VLRLAGLAAVLVVALVLIVPPPGPRSLRVFDPARVASLELDMWQAYYARERLRLFARLVTLLHEQNRMSWARSIQVGFHFARAAARFADLRGGYDAVLPDLERGYAIQREWLQAGFDPAAVARAELAWWVARRDPARNSPEAVGALIADEHALLYEVPRGRVFETSVLRARAARLRDDHHAAPDWTRIGEMLAASYRSLHAGVQAPSAGR